MQNKIFILTEHDTSGNNWKWSQVKIGGASLSLRCSMPMASGTNNVAYCFGGVFDEEEDEDLLGSFYNDLYSLDLEKLMWRIYIPSGKRDVEKKKKSKENSMEGR